jgi:hypothetical protein
MLSCEKHANPEEHDLQVPALRPFLGEAGGDPSRAVPEV